MRIKVCQSRKGGRIGKLTLFEKGLTLRSDLEKMPSSGLRARKIGELERKIVCSPDYLARTGPIDTLEDLARSDFVALEHLSEHVTLTQGDKVVQVAPQRIRAVVDSVAAARSAVLAGLGVQRFLYRRLAETSQMVGLCRSFQTGRSVA